MKPLDLLDQAEHLAKRSPKKPRQADLCRAVSSAYYGVFHALCAMNADMLVGVGVLRLSMAWRQAYRSVDHGQAKKRCKDSVNNGFPPHLVNFANAFVKLQELRHRADYDPQASFLKSEVMNYVAEARHALSALRHSNRTDRRAFAVYVLLPQRG